MTTLAVETNYIWFFSFLCRTKKTAPWVWNDDQRHEKKRGKSGVHASIDLGDLGLPGVQVAAGWATLKLHPSQQLMLSPAHVRIVGNNSIDDLRSRLQPTTTDVMTLVLVVVTMTMMMMMMTTRQQLRGREVKKRKKRGGHPAIKDEWHGPCGR